MAIGWTVQVLAAGHENRQVVETGAAGTEREARAAATGALMAGARERERCEFWVTVGGSVIMVAPGLDHAGRVDVTGLRDALDSLRPPGRRDARWSQV